MLEMQLHHAVTLTAAPLISATTLAAMHWFPHRPRGHVARYALGTSVVVGVPVAAMLVTAALGLAYPSLFWAALLVVNTAIGGATVAGAYWLDSRRAVGHEEVRDVASEWR